MYMTKMHETLLKERKRKYGAFFFLMLITIDLQTEC